MYWDPSQTDGAGSGWRPERHSWNSTDLDWYDPSLGTDVAWTNGSNAVFSGPGGTLNVAGEISANSISFVSDGYTLQDASGGSPSLSTATVFVAGGMSATIDAKLSQTTGLSVIGGGTVILDGDNTYTGATEIEAGTLQLASSDALGGSTVIGAASGGTLDLDGQSLGTDVNLDNFGGTIINSDTWTQASIAGTINASMPASFTVGGSGAIAISGTIEGSGSLTDADTGLLTLTASNAYTGGTYVDSGVLNINSADALGPDPSTPTNDIFFDGYGTLQFSADVTFDANRMITIGANSVAIFDVNGNQVEIDGVISGAGGLVALDSYCSEFDTLTLTGANTYSGGTTVSQEMTLQVGNDSALGSSSSVLTNDARSPARQLRRTGGGPEQ